MCPILSYPIHKYMFVCFFIAQIVEENKSILKRKFEQAKKLGILVNNTRNKMNEIKIKIQQFQISKAMNKMNMTNLINDNDDESLLRHEIENEKQLYGKYYLSLKNIKIEIDHIKCMLKKNRKQIQLDFENYWQQIQYKKRFQQMKKSKLINKTKTITGDKVADENIVEFYRMRDEILQSIK